MNNSVVTSNTNKLVIDMSTKGNVHIVEFKAKYFVVESELTFYILLPVIAFFS